MTTNAPDAADKAQVADRSNATHPALEYRETIRGSRPGDRMVRIATYRGFGWRRGGRLVLRPGTGEPTGGAGLLAFRLKHLLFGAPIPTDREVHERLTKTKALAVFSSDALSSVAYATEEIMKVLVLGGFGLIASLTLPLSGLIVLLLVIVVLSYRQTIEAYPSGGGSYIVASDNLGMLPGLTAAASLLIDYVLTVSVSIAAGVAALTSLVPEWLPFTIPMTVGAVVLIAVANLRGLRESGSIFSLPTYTFVAIMYLLLAYGLFRLVSGGIDYSPPPSAFVPGGQAVTLFLILSAFAQGCAAMTGTEAISNGVPAFKPPEWRNARGTLLAMGCLLGTMFIGISYLAVQVGIQPAADETVLSQIGRAIFGNGPLWIVLQVSTALILVLAANTSFADFPRLASILARDQFLPRIFQFRGDRLAFTGGVVALAGLAIALLLVFGGSLDLLIPLYAVGVFMSFTLSQAGMVVHWQRVRGSGWRRSAGINGLGAATTGIVTLVVAITKFQHGAWLVVLLIPCFIAMFSAIHLHYQRLAQASRAETPLHPDEVIVRTVVPIGDLSTPARQAVAYARAISLDDRHVLAVHISDSEADAESLQEIWSREMPDVRLLIIESPFRTLSGPFLAYLDALKERHPEDTLTVVIPEFVPSHWWEHLLHNQTALRLKATLLFHPGIVMVSVPYHLVSNP